MKTPKPQSIIGALILGAFIIGTALFFVGCRTTVTPESIQSKAKGIAYLVTAESLREHPEWTEHFKIASYEFKTLAATTNVTLQTITDIVTQLPTKKLKTERAQLYITVGTMFLQDDLGEIAVKQPEELRRAALGAHEGIEMALAWAE